MRVPDTTVLHDGTTQPKAGRGPVPSTPRAASRRHPTGAGPPARVNCGVVGRHVWPRPEPPVAPPRQRTPMAETERERGRAGSPGACKVTQAGAATLVVPMAARDGARQEWWVDARRRAPDHRAAGILRATGPRRLAPGAVPRDGWAERQQTSAWGPLPIDRARQPARPPRPGTLASTATPVPCPGARRLGGQLPPVTVRAVAAQESRPPQGAAPVAWCRLPRLPGTAVPRACLVVQWERGRWAGARLCRVLKHGGQSAQVRVQTAPR